MLFSLLFQCLSSVKNVFLKAASVVRRSTLVPKKADYEGSKTTTITKVILKAYLLDLALQMQQPLADRKTFGLWKVNIAVQLVPKIQLKHTCKLEKKITVLKHCFDTQVSSSWSTLKKYLEQKRENSPKSVLLKTRSPNAFGCYDPSWRTPRFFYRSLKEGGSMQTEREGNRKRAALSNTQKRLTQ